MEVLYSVSKTGKILVWQAVLSPVLNEDGHLEITITSGQQEGKKVNKVRLVKSGKNIGRANETTIQKQAADELDRLYTKQYDKGYVNDVTKVSATKQVGDVKKPQLAHKYPDRAHKLCSPDLILTQPKIDGVRCFITMTEDGLRFTSRTGKPIPTVPRIAFEIGDKLPLGHILDGELYIEGYELQDIVSVVLPTKNKKVDELDKVMLYWYDYIPEGEEGKSYTHRFINCELRFNTSVISKLKCDLFNEETLESTFDRYIAEGYEGMMLRDSTEGYKFGVRTNALQKYKKMHSEEFQIQDIIDSPQDNAPRFVCDLRNGNSVTVRLVGDKDDNMKYLENKEEYIGKWMTVKYQAWTKTGSVQFPVGEGVREGSVVNGVFVPSF